MNHSSTFLAAAADDPYALVLSSFLLFMVVALFGSVFAGLRGDSPPEFYIGDRQGSALKNGLALAGCYVSRLPAGMGGQPRGAPSSPHTPGRGRVGDQRCPAHRADGRRSASSWTHGWAATRAK